MIYLLLLLCTITTTPEQRKKYGAICIKEVVGSQPAVMRKVYAEQISACILAKDGARHGR